MKFAKKSLAEAAIAFACTPSRLLVNVEFPLAMPSIMTCINQTILMSLSIVVLTSLIGAEGLVTLLLEALQYVVKSQSLLGGLAILFCAMVNDRIAQGMYRRRVVVAVSGCLHFAGSM
jgi:glycine betaine/proline transport system permease protein